MISLSRCSFANRSGFEIWSEPAFGGTVLHFSLNDGLMFTSITNMDLKMTVAVMTAKAFWWNTGSWR